MAGRNKWPPKNYSHKEYVYGDDNIYEQLDWQRQQMERVSSSQATSPTTALEPPLVYIANVGMHDYSATFNWTPLGRDGIRKVTSGDIDRKNPQRTVYNVVQGLQNFKENDYFVFSGSPIPFALGLAYLLSKHEQVQVLYYLKMRNEYFPVTYTQHMFAQAEGLGFESESSARNNENDEYAFMPE
jgi:hypothetical protein